MSVFGTVFGAAAGASTWTDAEKEQIRFRLQIDGTQTPPAVDAASQLPVSAISLGSTAEDQVNTQCDSAIETYGLHWLFNTAMGDPANNTFAAKLVSASVVADWSDYDNETESLGGLVANSVTVPTNWSSMAIDTSGRVTTANVPDFALTTTVATAASFTSFTLATGSSVDDYYNGLSVRLIDAGNSSNVVTGTITDYVGSTKTCTVRSNSGLTALWTLAAGDTVQILGIGSGSEDVNVSSISAGAITAASIASGALNGKGNWMQIGTSYTWTNDDTAGSDAVTVTATP